MLPRSSVAALLVSMTVLVAPAYAQKDGAGAPAGKTIRTLKDIRNAGVVRQRWDLSCGAAALSTLLTYEFKDNTPESSIVVWILHRTDPQRVRARGGFSLLDLKHFSQARGYDAEGFSDMSFEELAGQNSAAIVPVRVKGFDHFVVVKGVDGDRVLLADPGFGNVTMKKNKFEQIWKDGVVFVVHPPDDLMRTQKNISASAHIIPDETLISRITGASTPTNGLY